ncbi:phage baseplate assembly protein V [Aquabacterium olei]|uniref:phage baseplate assembly protein V n=1 Tax=Aquabacterium olei TaxID=1296669 RepID=UPI00131F3D6F|nr:phage baseplate assembly protein V [Aquabacterium olei]
MKQLLNTMRLQALMANAGRGVTRLGTVTSYNPNDYSVKVSLQPEGVETGWIPLGSPWVGNGWGLFSPPAVGDMVHVEFQEGHPEAGIASLRLFSDEDRPLACPSGELWMVHQSGAFFKLTNDGAATFSDGHGATVKLAGNGTITSQAAAWSHTGPMTIDGVTTIKQQLVGQGGMAISGGTGGSSATIAGTLKVTGGDVTADAISLKTHKHGGVSTGSGITGVAQ